MRRTPYNSCSFNIFPHPCVARAIKWEFHLSVIVIDPPPLSKYRLIPLIDRNTQTEATNVINFFSATNRDKNLIYSYSKYRHKAVGKKTCKSGEDLDVRQS